MIFEAMGCLEEHKVNYAAFMLSGEARNWWKFTKSALPTVEGVIGWDTFKAKFLGNYFPIDLCKQKAREFLKLKQENLSVGDYTSKFNDLVQYCPQYQGEGNEEELCAHYENGLKAEIREVIGHWQITDFNQLVTKCRIFETNHKGKQVGGSGGPMRSQTFSRDNSEKSKPYLKFNQSEGKKSTMIGSTVQPEENVRRCFNCGGPHLRRNCYQLQRSEVQSVTGGVILVARGGTLQKIVGML